ncbi:subtilisin-like protease [Typha angustifolia]|uniref:subtilisin-like protease n=1 Tax=Typha angustifolia TaxID=59011 RepID=UPI003C2F0E5D
MAISFFLVAFLFQSFASLTIGQQHNSSTLNTYIVHVNQPLSSSSSSSEERDKWYKSFLPVTTASVGDSRLIYSYSDIISGFAARLTEAELEEMSYKEGFIYAYIDSVLSIETTHSPGFLGLRRDAAGFWDDSNYGKGVIVGIIDTGISPHHPSFNDKGMPPPPSKWKGACEFNTTDCNNKLIGARTFLAGAFAMNKGSSSEKSALASPYDEEGHGTHTASTAAGVFVDSANINGLANGTASGIAPYAHLAIYKVCSIDGCFSSDVLAGMDSAVNDGVDILSLSLGGFSFSFYRSAIAIGAFAAMEKGVFVSCAAGNSGPYESSLSNEAPWILTVGASTMDRLLPAVVKLGSDKNASSLVGQSAYHPSSSNLLQLPLIYPGLHGGMDAAACTNGSLDDIDVRGKVVICDQGLTRSTDKGKVVKATGGVGMIIANTGRAGFTTFAEAHVLPVAHVSYADGIVIKAFAITAADPTAAFQFNGTVIGTTPSPAVAYFSSRGPSYADPNILKPDIIGPGVNILAAWPFKIGSSGTYFNMISGTSMSTPHLSGVAALLKSAHPDWSPAAIKSAIMTTASLTGNDGNPIVDETLTPAHLFAIGAGHVNPSKANNPGLIYDIKAEDYLRYLCGLDYTDKEVSAVARRIVNCSVIGVLPPKDLNYPSLSVFLNTTNKTSETVTRTVTNVGAPISSYSVQVSMEDEDEDQVKVKVEVNPRELSFSKANEKANYSVTFTTTGSLGGIGKVFQGHLTWVSSGNHTTVSSPLLVAVDYWRSPFN